MSDISHNTFSEEEGFDYMRYLHLVMDRKSLFVTIALSVMLLSLVLSYALPKKYSAESVVFIEQNVISDLVKGIAVTPSMDMKIKAIKVTMLSRTMLLDIIKQLDLDLNFTTDQQLDLLISGLQKRIKIDLDEKRGVFKISFTDKNPVLARDVVNTLTRLYIEKNVSTKRKESYEATQFLAEQIDIFKKRIDDAEKAIDDFKSQSGLILNSNEGMLNTEIDRAQKQLDTLQIQLNSAKTKRQLLLQSTPLRKELNAQQVELERLMTKYTKNHPSVVQLRHAIQETQLQLQLGRGQEINSVSQTEAFQSVMVEIASLEKMKENYVAVISENKKILKKIPAMRTQLLELERKKQNEVIIYEKLVSRYGQSEVSKEMELQDKSVSFRVLDPAVVPAFHSSPKRPLILIAGLLGGFMISFGVIFLMDIINPSIKNLDDLRQFGLPILAVIPKVYDASVLRKNKTKDLFWYALGVTGIMIIFTFLALEILAPGLMDKAFSHIL